MRKCSAFLHTSFSLFVYHELQEALLSLNTHESRTHKRYQSQCLLNISHSPRTSTTRPSGPYGMDSLKERLILFFRQGVQQPLHHPLQDEIEESIEETTKEYIENPFGEPADKTIQNMVQGTDPQSVMQPSRLAYHREHARRHDSRSGDDVPIYDNRSLKQTTGDLQHANASPSTFARLADGQTSRLSGASNYSKLPADLTPESWGQDFAAALNGLHNFPETTQRGRAHAQMIAGGYGSYGVDALQPCSHCQNLERTCRIYHPTTNHYLWYAQNKNKTLSKSCAGCRIRRRCNAA